MKWVYGAAICAACVCALVGGWLWRAGTDAELANATRAETSRAAAVNGGRARPSRTATPAEEPRTRAASSVTRAKGGAPADARPASRATGQASDTSVGVAFGSGRSGASDTSSAAPDAQRREQMLYAALAEMWPKYVDAVGRSNTIQDTRPEEPGKQATEAEKEEWREKDAAFQAALQPVDAECWQYRDRLKEMFPEAIAHEVFRDDDGNQTGYSWRLHMDKMRQAVGGRLPSEG